MITAKQAKEIAGPTAEELVYDLEDYIKEAANNKQRKIIPHNKYKGEDYAFNFWVSQGYKPTKKWKEAKKILEGLGYTVKFYYEERQFVDMYTIIEW